MVQFVERSYFLLLFVTVRRFICNRHNSSLVIRKEKKGRRKKDPSQAVEPQNVSSRKVQPGGDSGAL